MIRFVDRVRHFMKSITPLEWLTGVFISNNGWYKSQLEHILLRPDTYIGSLEPNVEPMWIFDLETKRIVKRQISHVPGLYKIFDEILINAAEHKYKDNNVSQIRIDIDKSENELRVWNNGKGIPVVQHPVQKLYIPEILLGTFIPYDEYLQNLTGKVNGFGAKLSNIFSRKFTIETCSKVNRTVFKQTWCDNMSKRGEPQIWESEEEDYTLVTLCPDLARFGMDKLDDGIVSLLARRAYDLAACLPAVEVVLNGETVHVRDFEQYVHEYVKDKTIVYEQINEKWKVAVSVSDNGLQQISFVNCIATTKGGTHVDHVVDQLTQSLAGHIKKMVEFADSDFEPQDIKKHLWIFVNCVIDNPAFDSQVKDKMALHQGRFGSTCQLSDTFVQNCLESGIVESLFNWLQVKPMMAKNLLMGIPKLLDADEAGGHNSSLCTLILTQGDAAWSVVIKGMDLIARDRFGVYPIKGKLVNVRDASQYQIRENTDIKKLMTILGLEYEKTYEIVDDMATLRYGRILLLADRDADGSHLKGLVLNFIHYHWPSLIGHNFVEQFIHPIIRATKATEEHSFVSDSSYNNWKNSTPDWKTWKIKYYRAVGSWTSHEINEDFSNMDKFRIAFDYTGERDDYALQLAFSKKCITERKDWLFDWMKARKDHREKGISEPSLYEEGTKTITIEQFVQKELVEYLNMDNERCIPNVVDGLKPHQRKVLFTCLQRRDNSPINVAQLASSVSQTTAYHHSSLTPTIVSMAHNFVGSNNINLLLPIGQFGTRLQGGRDSANPQHIHTKLNPVTRTLFPMADDRVLHYLWHENQCIEPEWFCPIIPTVLINGALGIGTSWSTDVPNFNPRRIVDNIRRMFLGESILPMEPWYKNFNGSIECVDEMHYIISGRVDVIDEETIEITELPIKTWTQVYKENVLQQLLVNDMICDFTEHYTDTKVKFVVKLAHDSLKKAQEEGLHKLFKLETKLSLGNMILFDVDGVLRHFESVEEIMTEFFRVRRSIYLERKKHELEMLQAQSCRLRNQSRFISELIQGDVVIANNGPTVILDKLLERNYEPDPWKKFGTSLSYDETGESGNNLSDFEYLVTMPLMTLSEQEKNKLEQERDDALTQLHDLEAKNWQDLWNEDLDAFLEILDKQEQAEFQEEKSLTLA